MAVEPTNKQTLEELTSELNAPPTYDELRALASEPLQILVPIDIQWAGPYKLNQIRTFSDVDIDFGLYQIYSFHPIYGRSLVYIGKAREQTFSVRIPQHAWDAGSDNDPQSIQVYLGRLIGPTPTLAHWRHLIDSAEKLLIHSHAPAYNTNNIYQVPGVDECGNLHSFNWGACRSLAREVSGRMWTSAAKGLADRPPYRASDMLPSSADT